MASEVHAAWYRTQRWRRLALAHIATEPLCRLCLAANVLTPATVCDHIDPHRGDERLFWSGPFQSLCATCHNGTKQRQEHGRTPQTLDADGWPT